MKHHDPTARRRGFTLIELLVVISIIALLISILLPALASAREAAMQIQCQGNIRSVIQATHMYQVDNGTYFPHGPQHYLQHYFDDSLNTYLGLGATREDTWNAEVWHCPMFHRQTDNRWGLFAYNPNVMGGINSATGEYWSYDYAGYPFMPKQNVKEADLETSFYGNGLAHSPSQFMLFVDGYAGGNWLVFVNARSNSVNQYQTTFPHFALDAIIQQSSAPYAGNQMAIGGTSSTAFQDGHVRAVQPNEWNNTYIRFDSWRILGE